MTTTSSTTTESSSSEDNKTDIITTTSTINRRRLLPTRGIKNITGVSCHLSCALQILCHSIPPIRDALIILYNKWIIEQRRQQKQQQQQKQGVQQNTSSSSKGGIPLLLLEFGHFFQELLTTTATTPTTTTTTTCHDENDNDKNEDGGNGGSNKSSPPPSVDPTNFYKKLEKYTGININDVGDSSNAINKLLCSFRNSVITSTASDTFFFQDKQNNEDIFNVWNDLCHKSLFNGITCQTIIGQKYHEASEDDDDDSNGNDKNNSLVIIQRTKQHGKLKDMAYPFPLVGKFDSVNDALQELCLNGTNATGYKWNDDPNQKQLLYDEERIPINNKDNDGDGVDDDKNDDQRIFVSKNDGDDDGPCSWVTRKILRLKSLPYFWILHLERFSYDENGTKILSNPLVDIPSYLEMSKYCTTTRAAGAAGDYSLRGAILHVSDDGNIEEEGHYISAVKIITLDDTEGGGNNSSRRHDNNNEWILIDDEKCKTVTEEKVLELASGHTDTKGRFFCATLLVYGCDDPNVSDEIDKLVSDLREKRLVLVVPPPTVVNDDYESTPDLLSVEEVTETTLLTETVVGRRLKIRWAKGKYYPGMIQSYNPSTKKHVVLYDDGDIKEYNLSKKTIEWL